ncbi:hypothetical protein VB773_05095 [Haloarculaceae archaeon H-GB2-1]|nr:hypothetical protein [Haloarculaceae archaeon H-GB11]MEA5407014.1 hypothetical protein [Haloarculaceae archaeon H-GB2-1]
MEFREDEVVIDKPPSDLDELLLSVVRVLDDVGIEYAVVSGYVAVLFGRSRATEDIDVITERFDEETAEQLVTKLCEAGYWGSAMPLSDLYETLSDDLPIRVAEDGHRVPNVELKFASDSADYTSLGNTITVTLSGESFQVGALEFQIAYKLSMGTQKDFEDALYLYEVTEPNLNPRRLQEFAEQLDVGDEYEKLRSS